MPQCGRVYPSVRRCALVWEGVPHGGRVCPVTEGVPHCGSVRLGVGGCAPVWEGLP